MSLIDAAYVTVHDALRGAEGLAAGMGMSATILRNKVNPNNSTHHLTLRESSRLMDLTDDFRILDALAAEHGHVCLRVEADTPASDLAVLELVTKVWRANGDVGRAVDEVLADGKVEAHEIKQVKQAIYREVQALNQVLMRLEEMAG